MTAVNIVKAAQNGEQSAFQQLYDMYLGEVYLVVKGIIHDEDDAQDITHDVFVIVMEKISELHSPQCFHSWLKTVTLNQCRLFLRNRHEYVVSDDENTIETLATTETGDFTDILPCENLDRDETQKIIYHIITELSEKHKTVIFMHYYSDMPIEQIARELDVSIGTVKSRLNYARKAIEHKLKLYEKKGIKLYSIDAFTGLYNMISCMAQTAEIPVSLSHSVYALVNTSANLANTTLASAITGSITSQVSTAVTSAAVHTVSNTAAVRISVGTSAAAVFTACTILANSPPPSATTNFPVLEQSAVSEVAMISETSPESVAESAVEHIIESYIESSLSENALTPADELSSADEPSLTDEPSPAENTITPIIIKDTSIITETSVAEVEIIREVEKIQTVTNVIHDTEYVEVEKSEPEKDYSQYYFEEDDNYQFIVYPNANEAVLMRVKSPDTLGETIDIPDNINGIPVNEIGTRVFEYLDMQSVVIPDTVTKIASGAFEMCQNLEQVHFSENLQQIDMYAFYKCGLTDIVLPSELTSIGVSAFEGNPLTALSFGSHVERIAANAFANTNIVELDFNTSPVIIEKNAFQKCTALKKVHFSPYTRFVMENFSTCTALEELSVDYNGINYWHYSSPISYRNMPELKAVNINVCDGVTTIDKNFFSCFAVDIYVQVHSPLISRIYIPQMPCDLKEELAEYADNVYIDDFCDYTDIYIDNNYQECICKNSPVAITVTLPDSLETIGEDTFRNYTHLKSLTIPPNVSTIGDNAFEHCVELAEITVSDNHFTIPLESHIQHTQWYQNQSDNVFSEDIFTDDKKISSE